MIRKALHIALIFLVPIMLLVLLGFAVSNNKKQPCLQLIVSVQNSNEKKFVDAEKLKNEILQRISSIEGHPVRGSLLEQIKEVVSQNPYVKRSKVYRTIDGNVNVEVTQRIPLFRVITAQNRGYYIDVDGRTMPLSNYYTARVLIAGGNIFSGYSANMDLTDVINSKDATSNERLLADLYKLVSFIYQNPFWDAFIDYIHVKPGNRFELTPKNGVHIVEFGTIDRMEQKFRKLEAFYLNGLSLIGWEKYRKINVQFRNQVVCSN